MTTGLTEAIMKCMILVNLMGFSSLSSICHSLHARGWCNDIIIWVSFCRRGKKCKLYPNFFWNFTVTKNFDFFKIPQLFWRPFVNLSCRNWPICVINSIFIWNYKHPGDPVVITIIFYKFLTILVLWSLFLINHHWENNYYHLHDRIGTNGGHGKEMANSENQQQLVVRRKFAILKIMIMTMVMMVIMMMMMTIRVGLASKPRFFSKGRASRFNCMESILFTYDDNCDYCCEGFFFIFKSHPPFYWTQVR